MTFFKIVAIAVVLCFYLACFFWGVNAGFNVYIAGGLILLAFLVSYAVHAIADIGNSQKNKRREKGVEANKQKSIDNER